MVAGVAVAAPKSSATPAKSTSTSVKTTSTPVKSTSTSSKAAPSTVTVTATAGTVYSGLPQVARFENDQNIAPIIAAVPVNLYNDIFYNGMVGIVNGVAGTNPVSGILPNSPLNDIGYGPNQAATILQGQPAMTTVYQDSTVSFFDLISFFFGCTLASENSEAAFPEACNVTTTCVNPAGQTVASQTFEFKTNGGVQQQQIEARPIGHKGCQFVNFNTTDAVPLLTATLLDTISYIVYSKLPLSP